MIRFVLIYTLWRRGLAPLGEKKTIILAANTTYSPEHTIRCTNPIFVIITTINLLITFIYYIYCILLKYIIIKA